MLANDPLSLQKQVEFSRICLSAGAFEKQLDISSHILAEYPGQSSALRHRGESLIHLGRYEEAEAIFAELVKLNGYASYGLIVSRFHLQNKEEAYKLFQKYRSQLSPKYVAIVFFAFHEADSAFVYLEKSIHQKDLGTMFLAYSGFLQPYKDDPRFQAILRKLSQSDL